MNQSPFRCQVDHYYLELVMATRDTCPLIFPSDVTLSAVVVVAKVESPPSLIGSDLSGSGSRLGAGGF